MQRDTIGEIIFWATVVAGMSLYFFSAPTGLPWSASTPIALAWSGVIEATPAMPHPVWGYFVQVFGGHFVALSAVAAAVAGGLIGAMANRYFGWRVGTAAALTWIVLPQVWDRAITGSYAIFWAFGGVLALWTANAILLILTRGARTTTAAAAKGAGSKDAAMQDSTGVSWRGWLNRIAAWSLLVAAAAFAVVSVFMHDYTVGEVASAYAREMLEEVGERIAVMSGVADEQMIWEAERQKPGSSLRLIALRSDENYLRKFAEQVRRDWPAETNLWIAAQVGPTTFAEVAEEKHPGTICTMTGTTTTPEKWEKRWKAMSPYLKSNDRFVPAMRRAFAYEANTLGNRLQEEGKMREAWALYWRIVEEIDSYNISAYVNLSEMLRRGHTTDAQKRKRIDEAMAEVRKGLTKGRAVEFAAAVVAACGPVRRDAKMLEEMRERAAARAKEMEKKGEELKLPQELMTLTDMNNEMLKAHDRGKLAEAARIARAILAKREWHAFVPANAVMGTVMAAEGDYVASEAFYRIAATAKAKPAAAICNDYADTLRHLGRLAEAEKYARLAVEQAGKDDWLFHLTLAEVLRDAGKNSDEVQTLVNGVLVAAPVEIRSKVRKDFEKFEK